MEKAYHRLLNVPSDAWTQSSEHGLLKCDSLRVRGIVYPVWNEAVNALYTKVSPTLGFYTSDTYIR